VNDRSNAFLHLVDACQFTESELVDVYLGVCYRLKHLINLTETPIHVAVHNSIEGLKQFESDRTVSTEYIQELRDDH
jgi:hypothetical protein